MCCVILSKAACGAQCPRTKLLQYETLRHMPTSVVYLSAAAAVKDSGIRVGRKVRCVGASVVNSPCIRKENSSLMFAAHAPAPPKFRTICRKQQTRVRAPASAYAVEQPVILPGSWGYITPAGRAAALQRDLQDSKQLTSLPPWHASSCRRCACGWRGALWWVVVGLRERERESLAWMRRVKKRELDSVIELKSLIGIADDWWLSGAGSLLILTELLLMHDCTHSKHFLFFWVFFAGWWHVKKILWNIQTTCANLNQKMH